MNATVSRQPDSRTTPSGSTRRRAAFRAVTVISGLGIGAVLAVPGAVSSGAAVAGGGTPPRAAASPDMEFVHALPPGLLQPGEKVTLTATAEIVQSGTHPVGAAYVRGSAHAPFTRLPMTYNPDALELQVSVPAQFLRGSIFEDYVVVRDPKTGQVVTLPAGGAAAPYRSWIIAHPVTVALGTHTFGDFAKPQAIVARAAVGSGPGQVGIHHGTGGELSYGPTSFDIAPDGTVWVADTVNGRLLAYAPGKPGFPERTVTTAPLPLEVTIAPNGRIYVMTGSPFSQVNPRKVTAYSPTGKQLWTEPVYDFIFNNVMRADRDGVIRIDDPLLGWIPVTNRAGGPLTIAQQTRRTTPYQPLGHGLQLPHTAYSEHQDRIGLATTTGTLQHTWWLTSRTLSDPEWPPTRVGRDIVAFTTPYKPSTHQIEHLIVRFSPAGHIRNKISLDLRLQFGYAFGPFSDIRVGPDGKLYYLQTSDTWGMRVARYRWDG